MIPFMHRVAPSQSEDNPLWLVVLADMMTNLMLFFLVMFAMTQQDSKAQAALARAFDAKDVVEEAPKVEPKTQEFLEQKAAEELKRLFADVEVTREMIRVRLHDQPLFGSGQARLSATAAAPIAGLARVLKEMPNEVIVEGHTDNVRLSNSPYKSNWELSVARSYSVIERLAGEGVEAQRLVAAGYGEHHPAAGNDSSEGRARNRRVEIIIRRGAIAR
ncbi:MAG: OmpA family protein [Elusimicrobia bacterium]|nr:OmpA family protein [Elusimicrobiota bacterium]